jgi:hypothetical protein
MQIGLTAQAELLEVSGVLGTNLVTNLKSTYIQRNAMTLKTTIKRQKENEPSKRSL